MTYNVKKLSLRSNKMSNQFNDEICELIYKQFKKCLPLGLYKI